MFNLKINDKASQILVFPKINLNSSISIPRCLSMTHHYNLRTIKKCSIITVTVNLKINHIKFNKITKNIYQLHTKIHQKPKCMNLIKQKQPIKIEIKSRPRMLQKGQPINVKELNFKMTAIELLTYRYT